MSLDTAGLQGDIEDLAADPGDDIAACAAQWAAAVGDYASGVVPASTTVAAAQATLEAALAAAFAQPAAAPAIETAFAAFGVTVGGGMAPAFVAVPPAVPVGFVAQFAGPKPTTHAAAALAISTLIDTWARTGTATPSGGGAPVPWS